MFIDPIGMDTVNVNNNTPVKKDDVVVLDDKSTITASTDEVEIKPENDDFENKNIKLSGDEIKENQEIKRNKEIIGSIKMTLPYLKKEKKHFEMESKEAMKTSRQVRKDGFMAAPGMALGFVYVSGKDKAKARKLGNKIKKLNRTKDSLLNVNNKLRILNKNK